MALFRKGKTGNVAVMTPFDRLLMTFFERINRYKQRVIDYLAVVNNFFEKVKQDL